MAVLATITVPCGTCGGCGFLERLDVDRVAGCPECHGDQEIDIPVRVCETCGHFFYEPLERCQCEVEIRIPIEEAA